MAWLWFGLPDLANLAQQGLRHLSDAEHAVLHDVEVAAQDAARTLETSLSPLAADASALVTGGTDLIARTAALAGTAWERWGTGAVAGLALGALVVPGLQPLALAVATVQAARGVVEVGEGLVTARWDEVLEGTTDVADLLAGSLGHLAGAAVQGWAAVVARAGRVAQAAGKAAREASRACAAIARGDVGGAVATVAEFAAQGWQELADRLDGLAAALAGQVHALRSLARRLHGEVQRLDARLVLARAAAMAGLARINQQIAAITAQLVGEGPDPGPSGPAGALMPPRTAATIVERAPGAWVYPPGRPTARTAEVPPVARMQEGRPTFLTAVSPKVAGGEPMPRPYLPPPRQGSVAAPARSDAPRRPLTIDDLIAAFDDPAAFQAYLDHLLVEPGDALPVPEVPDGLLRLPFHPEGEPLGWEGLSHGARARIRQRFVALAARRPGPAAAPRRSTRPAAEDRTTRPMTHPLPRHQARTREARR